MAQSIVKEAIDFGIRVAEAARERGLEPADFLTQLIHLAETDTQLRALERVLEELKGGEGHYGDD